MANIETVTYRTAELEEVRKDLDHLPNLQIIGKAGKTKWLSISPEEFEAIRAVLIRKDETEQEAAVRYDALGNAIAELLHLKKERATGRFNTSYGTKSAEGLGRTVARIAHEFNQTKEA
jgi:hypothetical protein